MRIDLRSEFLIPELFRQTTGILDFPEITGIATDSRECIDGDLYIALNGERVDGHDFIHQAARNGAVAALVSRIDGSQKNIFQAKVESPLKSIGSVAKKWRSNFKYPVIGITGSNGKTSTKDLLSHVLKSEKNVHVTEGNHNTTISLPLTLLSMSHENDISILEMGASAPGEIEYLCSIASPTHGLITNIAPAHLEGFGSLEYIIREKSALFESLDNGVSFINMDDKNLRNISLTGKKVTFGTSADSDYRYNIEMSGSGYILSSKAVHLDTHSANMSFVKNCMAVTTMAIELGIDPVKIKEMIVTANPSKGRCEIKRFSNCTIIDDTYNANLHSVKAAIDYLKEYPGNIRRMMIFGDMKELGSESESHHQEVGRYAEKAGIDGLITIGTDSRYASMAGAGIPLNRHFHTHSELKEELNNIIQNGDLILIKGSRSMKMENIITMLENI